MATRDFIDYDGTTSYSTLTAALSHSGNFELEIDFATSTSSSQMLVGGTLAGTNELRLEIDASGFAKFYAYVGTTLQTSVTNAAALDDGKLHNLKATYTGTTAELFVDGVSVGTQTWALNGSQDIKLLGKISTGNFFNGTIADFKSTDLVTAGNSVIFPHNTTASTESSTINTGTLTFTSTTSWGATSGGDDWVGDELVTNGTFDTDTDWLKGTGWTISGNNASCDGTQVANTTVSQTSVVDAGNIYQIGYEVVGYSVGTVDLSMAGTGGSDISSTANGTYTVTKLTSTGGVIEVKGNSTFVGSVDNVTAKRFLEDAYVTATAALTGTVTTSITEADIVTGGDTIIIQLTGDTFLAAGTAFDDQRQAIIDGLNGV